MCSLCSLVCNNTVSYIGAACVQHTSYNGEPLNLILSGVLYVGSMYVFIPRQWPMCHNDIHCLTVCLVAGGCNRTCVLGVKA